MILVGNWKMAPEKKEQALSLAKDTLAFARKYKNNIQTIICPSFVHLGTIQKYVKEPLYLGAQNVSEAEVVSNTGLVSAGQLSSMEVSYVIVGHSEVRLRGDTNENIILKTQKVLEKKMIPIVCIGEKQRDAQGWYLSEIKDQIDILLSNLTKNSFKKVILAYEPVWAIGESAEREATPLECREMVIYIRKMINDIYGAKFAQGVKILYGGSVNENNARRFVDEGDVDGLLVGRVSLDAKRFGGLMKSLI